MTTRVQFIMIRFDTATSNIFGFAFGFASAVEQR